MKFNKQLKKLILLLFIIAGLTFTTGCFCKNQPQPDLKKGFTGKWELNISDYKNTCPGKPTVDNTIMIDQDGHDLKVTIKVKGPDGKMHAGTFEGKLEELDTPTSATLHGTFVVDNMTTTETLKVKFPNDRTYVGKANWVTKSPEGKTVCVGSQIMKGTKK